MAASPHAGSRTLRSFSVLLLVLLPLVKGNQPMRGADRKLLIRETPHERCRNTVQGLQSMADSRGYFCPRASLDYKTACCTGGEQFTCTGCSSEDKCCAEYETCVSCCMHPSNNAAAIAAVTPKSERYPASGKWADAFDYCSGICRSHGRSTVHENAYISNRHHCFSKLGRPWLSDPLPPGALDAVQVLMSNDGESCDAVCGRASKKCSAAHLPLLNSCDRLREHIGCEAGCEVSAMQNSAIAIAAMPAYVEENAPKPQRPAMCFTVPADVQLTCAGKGPQAKRICACA